MPRTLGRWLVGFAFSGLAAAATGQENPVFVDDSTLGADVLAGLPGLTASGNQGEAVRLLQRLLDEEGDRLVSVETDPALFEGVRERVLRVLLEDPDLLARYREVESVGAEAMLAAGLALEVERTRLLTRAGFEAALRVAAEHLGCGRFESARLTLEQLESHPDRDDRALAAGAGAVWARVSAYLDRPELRQAATRWAERAALSPDPVEPVAWPRGLLAPSHSPESVGGPLDSRDLVGTPLRSVDLQPVGVPEAGAEADIETRRSRGLIEYPYIFPLVVDDTVYTTDGLWISAWDRFTLTPRWQTKPRGADNEREMLEEQYAAAAYRKRQSRDVEEATSVAVHGRLLLAATGLVTDGGRTGDPRLHALDRTTGRVLWSSYIDEIDPQLEDSSTRGPAVFEGDIAVVAVRKIPLAKRFASAYLVGVDLADGSARWVRLAGSAGWLAYGGRGQWCDWPTLHQGVVYRVDELGVICAVEAGTGRFRWVRRLPGVESRLPSPRVPWASSRPVIDGDTMLVLSPDRGELLRIDLGSGAIVGRRDARPFGAPAYIFRDGEKLLCVGQTRVAMTSVADAITAPIELSPSVPDPGIVGRAVIAGDSLLLPLMSGVGVVRLADLREGRGIELDAVGNLVPLDNQLIAAENGRMHSYLVWDRAAEILRARLAADPRDISTAVTFAELAYRAGHSEAVLDPVDCALAAMGADPLAPAVRAGQRRLFELMLEMLREAEQGGEQRPRVAPELVAEVAQRLGRVALTPDERATHLLVLARARPAASTRDAVADCQKVIADPVLAGATWRRESSTVRAEIEATARLDDLLKLHGPGPYAEFEALAATELAALEQRSAAAADFEALARAYPRAPGAVQAWLRAAGLHEQAGLTLAADQALARGADAAGAMRSVGIEVQPGVLGEVLGLRVTSLVSHKRLDSAAAALRSAERDWPGVVMTAGGVPIDRSALAARLDSRLTGRLARPRIGATLAGRPTIAEGWALMRSLDRREAFASRPGLMMVSADRVGLCRFDPDEQGLRPIWTLPFESKPTLLRVDAAQILLLEPSDGGGELLAVSPDDGSVLWRTEPIGEAFASAEGLGPASGPERFAAPVDGTVSARDIVLAHDETVIAAVSRSGRVVGFDAAGGRLLWATRSACQAVHDAAAGDGVLVLGGTAKPESSDEAGEPIVLMLDLASGEEISRYTGAVSPVRWLKLVGDADRVVVGVTQGLIGLSIPEARADWLLTDSSFEDSTAAWAVGGDLLVQTAQSDLAAVDPRTGRIVSARLDVQGRLDLGGPVDIVEDNGRLALLSPGGYVALQGAGGAPVGADLAEQLGGGVVQPALADGKVVLFERDAIPGSPGVYRFHILEAATGRALLTEGLALDQAPRRVALLDDVILVTAGDSTVAIPTAHEP